MRMKKIKVERKGRVCKFPGCHVTLSVYNHECCCNLHRNIMYTQKTVKFEKI